MILAFAAGVGVLTLWKGPARVTLYIRSMFLITWYMIRGFFRELWRA